MPHVLRKDKRLFESWIQEHHSSLYRHALWMTSRSDVAEDCVQEAYYQAWRSRKSLKDETKIFSWLLTILRRVIYREYEQRANKTTCTLEDFSDSVELSVDDDQSKILDLAKAMNTLSTVHQDILLLHGLHGMSYQEISEILDVPIGTVMSRLSRARTALDSAINQIPDTIKQGQIINLKTGPYNER